jgi:hypothetical protein
VAGQQAGQAGTGSSGDRSRRRHTIAANGRTEIVKIPNRGHALTIDHGWPDVAETALTFVKRFT